MKIYITDLDAYNNGSLVGVWCELPMDTKKLDATIEEMLKKGKEICKDESYHEETLITDFECDYMKIDEYCDIDRLNDISEIIKQKSEDEIMAIKLLLENNIVKNIYEALENYEDMICTGESKMEDIAFSYIEESGIIKNLPEVLHSYFDYEALGRDMEIEGSYFRDENNIIWESLN